MNTLSRSKRIAWLVIRKPIVSAALVLWAIGSLFLATLQFSPKAQTHFSEALQSYGYSTASIVLSGAANSALEVSEKKNRALAASLDSSQKTVSKLQEEVRAKNARLDDVDTFQRKANHIVKKHNIRLAKTVIKTAAGEIFAWIPVVGDATSIYFAIDGTLEMCKMFHELEITALEHGLPFYIYTDTFCERPVEKTKEVFARQYTEITTGFGDSLRTQSDSRTEYWSGMLEAAIS